MTDEEKYIYESPDGGKTVYRRKFRDYNSKRELVTDGSYKKIKNDNLEEGLNDG